MGVRVPPAGTLTGTAVGNGTNMNKQLTSVSAVASVGFSVLRSLTTLSFLATTPELWQEAAEDAEATSRGTGRSEGHRASRGLGPESRRDTASRRRSSPAG